jgi:ABC-type nickel/cobalt efflux system permease component RcnA
MIIIAAAFLVLFIVWVVRSTLRRMRKAAAARAQTRGVAAAEAQAESPARPAAPDGGIPAAQTEEAEPPGHRMWGDLPGDEHRAAKGGGRP